MTPRERAIFVQGFCFATSRIVTREDMLGLCAKMLLAWGISMAEDEALIREIAEELLTAEICRFEAHKLQ